jgi:ABC-type lipoprotein release transport system permease subunit
MRDLLEPVHAPAPRAVRYGLLATTRRRRNLLLPAITVATGAFLLVIVVATLPAVRAQGEAFGDAGAVGRAAVAISVVVLVVGALEVAICATRSVAQRAREIGVLCTVGVPHRAVLAALLVEPVVTAAAGAAAGAALAAVVAPLAAALGWIDADVAVGSIAAGCALALGVSTVAAIASSAVPTLRAVRKPPLASLTA